MKAPQDVFDDIWQRKTGAASTAAAYAPGANLRVDAAARMLSGGGRLLDIGCGAGSLGVAIRGNFREVHGVDIAERAVEAARRNGILARRVDLNRESLPYDDSFFDTAAALSMLQLCYDPSHVLREACRVLRPGGVFVLSVVNMRSIRKLFQQVVLGRFPRTSTDTGGYDGGTLHYFCFKNMKELLEQSGFQVRSRMGIFCRPRFLEGRFDRVPLLGAIKAEFLSAEVFVEAVKR